MNDSGSISNSKPPRSRARWVRLWYTIALSVLAGFLVGWGQPVLPLMVARALVLGLAALGAFELVGTRPRRLPRRVARWALQVIAVGLVIPPAGAILFALTNPPGAPAFYRVREPMRAYAALMTFGMFVAPWAALASLVREKEAFAREQALEFELIRSELERRATDARLKLLQSQVSPHFLFNTLANVQALVDSGSTRASQVLRSLTVYLRAAVPRLDDPTSSMEREVSLARAYLELMEMRMPDRLTFSLDCDPAANKLRCPPMTLLTLVENAVRHGLDPSEEGGSVRIEVRRAGARCHVGVADTGVGLAAGSDSRGTGLATLRERLQLAFGGDATVTLRAGGPRGTLAELDFPAEEATS